MAMKKGDKCPRCGSDHTHFGESFSDGDEWSENSFIYQQCASGSCRLPCGLWDDWQELKASTKAEEGKLFHFQGALCRIVRAKDPA